MSVVGPTLYHDVSAGGASRLGGSLAVAATLAQGNTYRERLYLGGRIASLDVRAQMNVTGGTPTVQIVALRPTVEPPSLVVNDATTGLTTATNLVDDTEAVHAYTTRGEHVVDVVISTVGASAAGDITHIDVYAKRI